MERKEARKYKVWVIILGILMAIFFLGLAALGAYVMGYWGGAELFWALQDALVGDEWAAVLIFVIIWVFAFGGIMGFWVFGSLWASISTIIWILATVIAIESSVEEE